MIRFRSIRQRLLVTLLASLLGVSAVFTGATYLVERAAIEHYQDQRLRRIALDIPATLKSADLRSVNVKLFHGRDDFLLQVWQGEHEIYRSTIDTNLPHFGGDGFSIETVRGERWKLFLRHMGSYTVQVGQSLDEREALARERALHLIVPLILLIAIIALSIPIAVTAGLGALRRISDELDARSLDRLAPLDPCGEPREIKPLVNAINTLLARLGRAAVAQQQFLADASHELRTPLAGLQLQLEMAEQAADDASREVALAALKASIRRAGRLVEQLLTTSRLDADGVGGAPSVVSLNALVREAMIRLEPLAEAKRIDLGLIADEEATFRGDGEEIMLLILNLIDNAIRYTPGGGQIDVAIRRSGGDVALTVEDSGPGIAAADRPRAFDRFFRGAGHEVPGSGLGLAIVKRIADRHGATVRLDTSAVLGGLAATATFAGNSRT